MEAKRGLAGLQLRASCLFEEQRSFDNEMKRFGWWA